MNRQLAWDLLEKMILCRLFEETLRKYSLLGMIHGTMHLGIGEEAASVGTCLALRKEDGIFATHRGHNAAICKGADINAMMAELFGRATGCCKGRGGSMHIADVNAGVLGTNGIVGPSMALATGAAFARKWRGEDSVALAFFGDGATNEGIFHESLNLASIWKLPVIFCCTNNLYGMSTHISRVMKDTNIANRAAPYRMRAWTVDGNDAGAVFDTVTGARAYVREHMEPVLIVENTYRICGHSKSDDGTLYRTADEVESWKRRDPIFLHEQKMKESGFGADEDFEVLRQRCRSVIEHAVEFALASPYPVVEDIKDDVYAV